MGPAVTSTRPREGTSLQAREAAWSVAAPSFAQKRLPDFDYALRFFHTSFSHESRSQFAILRFDDVVSKLAKSLEIVVRGAMRKHVQIHGRCHKHRCFHGEIGGDEQVVCNAVRQSCRIVAAEAGAIIIASAQRPMSTWLCHEPSLRSKNSLATAFRLRVATSEGGDERLWQQESSPLAPLRPL